MQPAPDAAGEDDALEEVTTAVTAYGSALYRFSRPHTLFGTFVSVCSVSSLALVCFLASLARFQALLTLCTSS